MINNYSINRKIENEIKNLKQDLANINKINLKNFCTLISKSVSSIKKKEKNHFLRKWRKRSTCATSC